MRGYAFRYIDLGDLDRRADDEGAQHGDQHGARPRTAGLVEQSGQTEAERNEDQQVKGDVLDGKRLPGKTRRNGRQPAGQIHIKGDQPEIQDGQQPDD
ncbi:MAG: hypothetical protein R3C44_01325 [Chloroflexota bacterium]